MKKIFKPFIFLGKFKKLYVFIVIYLIIMAIALPIFNSSNAPIDDSDDLTKTIVEKTKDYHLDNLKAWFEILVNKF